MASLWIYKIFGKFVDLQDIRQVCGSTRSSVSVLDLDEELFYIDCEVRYIDWVDSNIDCELLSRRNRAEEPQRLPDRGLSHQCHFPAVNRACGAAKTPTDLGAAGAPPPGGKQGGGAAKTPLTLVRLELRPVGHSGWPGVQGSVRCAVRKAQAASRGRRRGALASSEARRSRGGGNQPQGIAHNRSALCLNRIGSARVA